MKTSAAFITTALLATTALAAPEPEAWRNYRKYRPSCPDDKNKSPIPFTSTYSIVATPDQVVDLENQYTGGLAVCPTLSPHHHRHIVLLYERI